MYEYLYKGVKSQFRWFWLKINVFVLHYPTGNEFDDKAVKILAEAIQVSFFAVSLKKLLRYNHHYLKQSPLTCTRIIMYIFLIWCL